MAQNSSLKSGVNLIPKDTNKPQPMRKAVRYGLMVSTYSLLGITVIAFALMGFQYFLRAQLKQTVNEIEDNLDIVQEKQSFESDFSNLQEYVSGVNAIYSTLNPQAKMFEDLESITPQPITLISFSLTETTLRLSGKTSLYSAVSDYIDELNKSGNFTNIQIVGISRPTSKPSDLVDFTLDLELKAS